jgi:hypothetical protein
MYHLTLKRNTKYYTILNMSCEPFGDKYTIHVAIFDCDIDSYVDGMGLHVYDNISKAIARVEQLINDRSISIITTEDF